MADIKDISMLFNEVESESKIREIIFSNEDTKYAVDKLVEEIAMQVRSGEDLDIIQKQHDNTLHNDTFWKFINEKVLSELEPYYDTEFIRKMDTERKYELINTVFVNILLQTEELDELTNLTHLTKEDLFIFISLINTVNDLVIVNRLTKSYFLKECENLFGFNSNDSDFLWHLFDANRNELTNIHLLRNINSINNIEKNIDMIFKTFKSLIDKEDGK